MNVRRYGSLIAVVVLAAAALTTLAVAPAATAGKPDRTLVPAEGDFVIDDQCGFAVLVHTAGGEINTDFFGRAGNLVKKLGVFPGGKLTLTNLDTGKSITVPATGSYQLRLEPDGSGSVMLTATGPVPNDVTGEPGLWYLSGGRIAGTFDANENMTSLRVEGRLVDLCSQLDS